MPSTRIKSNDRMPARSFGNVQNMVDVVAQVPHPHTANAIRFMERVSPHNLFEMLHSIRRWYSGQTMARAILAYRSELRTAMRLETRDVLGIYRGFKVDNDDRLARAEPGDTFSIPVTRNHGFSSWSLTEAPTHRFSGKSRGKTGLVVRLANSGNTTPALAPPERTAAWFNALYEHTIGRSFRPTEGEYLIYATRIHVEVVRVKR